MAENRHSIGLDADGIAYLRTMREQLERQLGALDELLGEAPEPQRRNVVGEDKLKIIRALIHKNGRMRQADIVSSTGYNSGTVSMALDTLRIAGEVKRAGKEDRSMVWELVTK